jgi:hypothetical protein
MRPGQDVNSIPLVRIMTFQTVIANPNRYFLSNAVPCRRGVPYRRVQRKKETTGPSVWQENVGFSEIPGERKKAPRPWQHASNRNPKAKGMGADFTAG